MPSRTHRVLRRLVHALLGVWLGAMLAQAFLAAPLVFGAVPGTIETKDAAARVIGPAFGRIDLFGILAATAYLLLRWRGSALRGWRTGVGLGLLVGAAVDAFVIAPAITARVEPLGAYHGAATAIWMAAMVGITVLLLAPGETVSDRG